jgi:spermidine synthase
MARGSKAQRRTPARGGAAARAGDDRSEGAPHEQPPRPDRRPRNTSRRVEPAFVALLACFLLSGFAALLYETVWTRHFAFVFGTSELAIASVLAAYMAGLALGAAVAGRLAPRIRRPVLVYGALELAIALLALLVPVAIRWSTALCVLLFGARDAPPAADGLTLAIFYLACAFLILLLPTACMGATLPILARHAVRRECEIGSRTGLLYAVNTLGAVLGTVGAAFVLMPALGLHGTLLVGAAVNLVVFGLAALLAWSAPVAPAAPPARTTTAGSGRRGFILPLILVSGVISFSYEILWTRLLGHVLGGSVYAFATMLASFLAGIAIGSAVASRFATNGRRAALGFAVAELGAGCCSLLAFHRLDGLPALALRLGAGGPSAQVANALLGALVLLPAAIFIGATFPFAVRVLAADESDAGPASARVYAWNTIGAIVGAVGTGFVLMPLLGYAGVALAAITLNLVLALAATLLVRPPARAILAATLAAGLVVAVAPPTTPWDLLAASPLKLDRRRREPAYYAVGRSATVSVALEASGWQMRTNGLPEGVILPPGHYKPSVLERWLGALPTLARPETRSMLVIGLGAGSALEAIASTVEHVDVIELEPRVLEANRVLRTRRDVDPLADPRIHVHVNDARGALVLTAKRYDAIVSQPSHPWTAGASHLYTREFFDLARRHLAPGGVLVQWIELEFVDEPLLRSLVATLLDVFPYVRVYRPVFRSGALFLASDQPLPVAATAARAIAASPVELARAGVQTPEDVEAELALDEDGARRFAAGGVVTTDDRNLLATRSPLVLANPLGSGGADRLLAAFDPLSAEPAELDRLYLIRRLIADWNLPRAARLVGTLQDPAQAAAASGLIAAASGRIAEATNSFREALRRDPSNVEARAGLLRALRSTLLDDDPAVTPFAADLDASGTAIVDGWRLSRKADWRALAVHDRELGAIAPRDPFFPDAVRLRAAWRIAENDPAAATEAIGLLDRLLPISAEAHDRVLRARASLASGNEAAALQSLSQAFDTVQPTDLSYLAADTRDVLGRIPERAELAEQRAAVERRLSRVPP